MCNPLILIDLENLKMSFAYADYGDDAALFIADRISIH